MHVHTRNTKQTKYITYTYVCRTIITSEEAVLNLRANRRHIGVVTGGAEGHDINTVLMYEILKNING